MKTGDHDGGSGSRRQSFQLSPPDGKQPAGRIMALVLAEQVPGLASYSPELDWDSQLRSRKLHRYRLTLRRAKTLLIAAERVFPPRLAASALDAVSNELQRTTQLRNLDVLAGSLTSWPQFLAPGLHGGLRKITLVIDERRDAEYAQLLELVDSVEHTTMVDQLRALGTVYRLGGEEPGPDVLVSARKVARVSFNAAWSHAQKAGESAMDSMDVDDWHRLRRRLKRVRYLMDALGPILTYPDEASDADWFGEREYRSLSLGESTGPTTVRSAGASRGASPADAAKAAKQIRKLLRGLGELQDMAVEAELLRQLGRQLGSKAAMSAGAMINPIQMEIPDQMRRSRKRWKNLRRFSLD